MYTIYRKELATFFNSLIGYLAISIFLLVTGLLLWVFPETSIIDNGYATLDTFFYFTPYVLLFLCPAIGMRSIAGEKSDGTFDLLISRPIGLKNIVLGKYFGSITILILAILPTIIYAITTYYLAYPIGNIDIGASIGSYIGLIFLGATFLAITLFCSALTKNPIIAFLISVFICFMTYYGFEAISQITAINQFEYEIKNLGIYEHYLSISRGVLTANDFIYFVCLNIIFIVFTIGHLGKDFRASKKTFTIYAIVLIISILLNQNFITRIFDRIDFTSDKRYTISKTSKDILSKIDKDIFITIFLDGELPSGFKNLKESAINMAYDLRSYSNGKIKINIINPSEGSQADQQELANALIERGLFPTNLSVKSESGFSQKLIFPSAIVNHQEQEINVNLLQSRIGQSPEQVLNNSIQNLEYAFISAISKIANNKNDMIAFTEGHGEPTDLELYDAMHTLGNTNQVGRLNLDSIRLEDLLKIRTIIVAKPQTKFSENHKYKLDYFIQHGGSIIWAIDPIDANMENLRKIGSQPLIGKELNLDDQLFNYGARINYDIIADLNCAQIPLSVGSIAGQSQIELAPWFFFPILMPNSTHPIVKNLDGIRTEFVSTIDTVGSSTIEKEIILQTSPFTRILKTPSSISLQMVEEQPDPTKFKSKPAAVALLLKGKFPFLYENRMLPEGITETVNVQNTKTSKMLVVSDGDWLINQVNTKDQSPYPLGWDKYTENQYANKTFLLNAIDYLMNDEDLITLRNREIKLRLLDKAAVKSDKLKWQIINVGLPIVIIIAIGIIQQYLRKRRYTKKAAV